MKPVDRLHDIAASLNRGVPNEGFRIDQLPSVWTYPDRTNWLIDGVVAESAITLLTGESGVGKSTVALAIAGAVAHGKPFLGLQTAQKHALYVDGENPVSAVRERLDRLQIADTATLKVWGGWNELQPQSPKSRYMLDWAEEYKGLIVVDSLIEFHPGSEQDASETRRYMADYRKLAHAGASVVVLHHTGKGDNSKQYRGSSDIKAAVDQAFVLEAIGDSDSGLGTLRLKPFKNRLAVMDAIKFEVCAEGFRTVDGGSSTFREIIEKIIAENPNQTGRQITATANEAGVPKNRTQSLLVTGEREGWLIVTEASRNSKLYNLAPSDG